MSSVSVLRHHLKPSALSVSMAPLTPFFSVKQHSSRSEKEKQKS